jgi:kynurenine formamidase
VTTPAAARLVDLSQPLDDATVPYPGDPGVRVVPARTLAQDGCNVLSVHLGSHSGTHVDAPFHVFADGARIDELPLELFHGYAVVVDVRDAGPRGVIGWEQLAPYAPRLGPGRLVVLHTGWSAHWGTEQYAAHPFLTGDAAQRLVATGVRTVGVDAFSIDETSGDGAPPGGFPAHEAVLGAGGVVVENLTGLDALIGFAEPVLSVLPLRLTGGDGAPVRAVAVLPGG